jgi:TRAP-type mannitol/chloroaromatic compound transport system permease small subunit
METIIKGINALNEKVGYYSALLILPLVAVVIYEVVLRYVFSSPTAWGFEMTTFIYGMHFMLCLADALRTNTHVSIDIFESRLAPRNRAFLRIFTYSCLFVPAMGFMAYGSIKYAATSWMMLEKASSSWGPAIYPYKTVMAIGFVLFFLAGIAKLLEDIRSLKTTN